MSWTRYIVASKEKKRVPFLGTILPFLFSREYKSESKVKVVMILTPKIINLDDYAIQSRDKKDQLFEEK